MEQASSIAKLFHEIPEPSSDRIPAKRGPARSPTRRMLKNPNSMKQKLLIAALTLTALTVGAQAQPEAPALDRTVLPPPDPEFKGKVSGQVR